jgi:hypothetical protein
MSLLPIRTAIRDLVAAVANTGVVHLYERYARDMATLKTLYQSAPAAPLCGWYVRREITRETGIAIPRYIEVVQWRLQGFMALDDSGASELTFDDSIEGIRDAFRADLHLGGLVQKVGLLGATAERGVQLDDAGPVMFAGVLCHAARIRLTTTRERTQ